MSKYDNKIIIKMWKEAITQIEENYEYFSQLDAVLGDGDHGISMLRIAKVMDEAINNNLDKPCNKILEEISEAILMADAGSSSPLLGSFFESMSESVNEDEMSTTEIVEAFENGLNGMISVGKAKAGDKTSLDTWLPAMAAMKKEANNGSDLKKVLEEAVIAATAGAESTKEMQARCGRARNYGEKSIGPIDAGAVSALYMIKGFLQAL